jgi:RimJ/RimL family protein N-acetyltransferase
MSLTFVEPRGIPPWKEDQPAFRIRAWGQATMQHTLHIEGFGVRLRPVTMEDAPFIVWLRNLEHARGRVGDSATDASAQQAWLKEYFLREGDYYFIIETSGKIPVGAYGIYDLTGDSAESGRWIVRPEVPAAIPSAILAFEIAFEKLRLRELRVKTVSTNTNVLSLNRKLGFTQTKVEAGERIIGGKPVDLVHFLLESKDWPKIREKFVPLARLAERQIGEWQQAELQKTHSQQGKT